MIAAPPPLAVRIALRKLRAYRDKELHLKYCLAICIKKGRVGLDLHY